MAGPVLPPPSHHGTYASPPQSEPPAISTIKYQLLLAAIDKSPRFRSDLDLLVITQYLGMLESLVHVSPQALHYLATECTSMTLRDGDVFCYQEDGVVADSSALVIIDGSLCGYFNKPFSQRHDTRERFSSWNARQNQKRGVLIDFGDFQTTYAVGALCGFEDLLGIPEATDMSGLMWYRRKGIHAQEQTHAISLTKDTLDRAAKRFHLTIERNILQSSREAASTDISHLAIFSAFSELARHALLQNAPRRVVPRGDTLFESPQDRSTITIDAVAIVLSGGFDIYWTGDHENSLTNDQQDKLSTPPASNHPLFSVRRGHTIGDQSLGLALDQLFDSSSISPKLSHPMNHLPVRIVSAEDTTEVMLIPFALYHEKRTEDHTLQEYAAQLHHERQLTRQPTVSASTSATGSPLSLFPAWAPTFFAAKLPDQRSLHDLYQLLWRVRLDSTVAKVFFQFPPLVLERMCHTMELMQFDATSPSFLVLEENASLDKLYVVVHGTLRSEAASDGSQDVFVAGDLVGLTPRTYTMAVCADAGTMLLTVPCACVERWLRPQNTELIVNAGSLFTRHVAYITTHAPRLASILDKRKSLAGMARRPSSKAAEENSRLYADSLALAAAHTDALATLLHRMGVLASVPHFLLRELLTQCTIVYKQPDEIVCHENDRTTSLVVLLSGFLRVFSLEHMGEAVDMFRQHTFCQFSSLHHLLTKQHIQHDVGSVSGETPGRGDAAAAAPIPMLARHRSAMYGFHLQTLHAQNAFRTGVLQDGTQCPATVVAQTPCTLLVLDDAVYTRILQKHTPGIDMTLYHLQTFGELGGSPAHTTVAIAGGQRAYPAKIVPPPLLRYMETCASPPAWLSHLSAAKRQLLLLYAKVVLLQPGDRLVTYGEIVDHVFVIVTGALVLSVRHHHDRVANALDASQRSVRSLLLERTVTSNYSTTSHQLSSLDAATAHGADSHRLPHKRALLQLNVNRIKAERIAPVAHEQDTTAGTTHATVSPRPPPNAATSSSLFVQSVTTAVHNEKIKSVAVARATHPKSTETVAREPTATGSPHKTATARMFHATVSRVTLAHRLDQRRHAAEGSDAVTPLTSARRAMRPTTKSPLTERADSKSTSSSGSSTLLCHLQAGDVYSEEALSSVVYRSPHDVVADAASTPTSTASSIELLCLSRAVYHSILHQSDDDAEQELRGRANAAKSKWQLAEQRVMTQKKKQQHHPKLLDLFKNILNQRYYVTMRAIAEIPLLHTLPDAVKQAICAGARFEAIEQFANVYKDDARPGTTDPSISSSVGMHHRYYFVLSGRIGLFSKSALHGNAGGNGSSSTGSAMASVSASYYSGGIRGSTSGPSKHGSVSSSLGPTHPNSHLMHLVAASMDACLQEVAPGHGFGEFEVLVPEASRHHMLAVALEPTKLLSLPGALFAKYWPHVRQMEQHIAYVRRGAVPFFARLEMEKIASLYHAMRDETSTRGARILEQQQPLQTSEIVLIKDGECSIRTTVTIQSLVKDDENETRTTDVHLTSTGRNQEMRVLATIADVCTGHVFWLDGPGHVPFTLDAISSHVAIARISVDKLQSILPKTHFAQLEDCSAMLAALYREQLTHARHTIVRVLNEKRKAEMGRSAHGDVARTFLPSLHYSMQTANKKTQLQSLVANRSQPPVLTEKRIRQESDDQSSSPAKAIPYARVLASRPIDLVRVHADESTTNKHHDTITHNANGSPPVSEIHSICQKESKLDSAYRAAHHLEHYQMSDAVAMDVSATMLRGSFPDDPSLRSHRRVGPSTTGMTTAASIPKIDETAAPETTTPAVVSRGRMQLQVTLPTAAARDGSGRPRSPGPFSTVAVAIVSQGSTLSPPAAAKGKKTPAKHSIAVDYDGDPVEWEDQIHRSNGKDDDKNVDFVMDVRATLHAALQSPLSPLRSMKLEPSGSKLHSMGKYIRQSDAPQPSHHLSTARDATSPLSRTNHVVAAAISPCMLPSERTGKRPMRIRTQRTVKPTQHQQQDAVTRKHGFLHVLPIPHNARVAGFVQDQFLRTVVHRQKRRLVLLEDTLLKEFEEDTKGYDASSCALRSIDLTHAALRDAPNVATGENETILRHSFLLATHDEVSVVEVLLFTCDSLIDKTSWMHAIRTAAALGVPPPLVTTATHTENGAPGSPQYRHRQSMAMNLTNREMQRASLAATVSSGGRNAVVQEEVLEVEYRIS